ncbi:hypothetical protein RND71_005949 [Anisodus tanguticus]|uniref:Reverse transcriptase zinc-binding domain-containing protein n=1 Tax=Anisodus tanguticus TaxID=243964 RepID=A0AAE1SU42_9SOLA|nr:hypothetical protein RND71_005949 [Anisodus tanguticus]
MADMEGHLCNREPESIEYLFFKCYFSDDIWSRLLGWLGINRMSLRWSDEITWAVQNASVTSCKAEIFRMVLSGCIYQIWLERNQRIFLGKACIVDNNLRRIAQDIHVRGEGFTKIAGQLRSLNVYPLSSLVVVDDDISGDDSYDGQERLRCDILSSDIRLGRDPNLTHCAVKLRLHTHHQNVESVLSLYKDITVTVDGSVSKEEVFAQIDGALSQLLEAK